MLCQSVAVFLPFVRVNSCWILFKTRMHSSRMRTARLRIVPGGGGGGEGGVLTWSKEEGGR